MAAEPEWVVLGSGTAVPHADRGSASHLLCGAGGVALFDSGSGTKDRLASMRIRLGELTHLVYTHAHLDHWADLLSLLFYRAVAPRQDRRPGLVVAGPPGFPDLVREVAQRIDPGLLDDNGDVEWREVAPGRALDAGWFRATAHAVEHGRQRAQAYRVEGPGMSVCYSGDTGPCEGLDAAAKGAACLVCECSFPDGAGRKNHMTPSAVRDVADRCRVATVVLTHLYPDMDGIGLPGPAFDGFSGRVLVAHDGLRVPLRLLGE